MAYTHTHTHTHTHTCIVPPWLCVSSSKVSDSSMNRLKFLSAPPWMFRETFPPSPPTRHTLWTVGSAAADLEVSEFNASPSWQSRFWSLNISWCSFIVVTAWGKWLTLDVTSFNFKNSYNHLYNKYYYISVIILRRKYHLYMNTNFI